MRVLLFLFLSLLSTVAAAPPRAEVFASSEDIAKTSAWFDQLSWPDLKGKPYVEVTRGVPMDIGWGEIRAVEHTVRGLLAGEDEKSLTVVWDGNVAPKRPFSRGIPYVAERLEKLPAGLPESARLTYRTLDLAEVVKGVLASREPPRGSIGVRRQAPAVPTLALARFCAWQGRQDLAAQLEAELKNCPLELSARWQVGEKGDGNIRPISMQTPVTLHEVAVATVARARLQAALAEVSDPGISRAELLAQFEALVREFPANWETAPAPVLVKLLGQMVAEDEAHAKAAKPLTEMTPQEQVEEWIYQLREQTGSDFYWGGAPRIFGSGKRPDTPADHLARLDVYAVPDLIELIGDQRLTRVGGDSRSTGIRRAGITYGDCAEEILSKIAGIDFDQVPAVRGFERKPQPRVRALRLAAAKWWKEVGDRGLRRVMLDGIRSGSSDSVEQARRLATTEAALDSGERIEAISAGLRATKINRVRASLVKELAAIPGAAATEALRREVTQCASLEGRVTAATELFRRGDRLGVPTMIADWKTWKFVKIDEFDQETDRPEQLLLFMGRCGAPDALRAIIEHFPQVPVEVRRNILEFASETHYSKELVRPRDEPLSPEAEGLVDDLFVMALDDRTAQHRECCMSKEGTFHVPRVCDYAARALAKRFPQRFTFKQDTTRIERDRYIDAARTTLRAARGLPPALPAEPRPAIDTTGKNPNLIAGIRWIGGEPAPGLPLTTGQPLTPQATLETIVALHRALPKDCHGFSLSAERPGDGKGFAIEIEWLRGAQTSAHLDARKEKWSFTFYMRQTGTRIYDGAGQQSYREPATPRSYPAERDGLEDALGIPANQPTVIYFSDRMTEEE